MITCPLCKNSSNNTTIETNKVYGNNTNTPRAFHHCLECDVFFQWPRLTASEEKDFYVKEFEKFMSSRAGEKGARWLSPESHIKDNQKERSRREKYLRPIYENLATNSNILEIGCSSGFMLYGIPETYGHNIFGVEPSGVFLQLLKDKGLSAYDDFQTFKKDLPNLKLDLITHFFVLEHIQDPVAFLKENFDQLAPNGKIVCEIPNANDPLRTLYSTQAFKDFYWSIAHPWYFTPKSVEYLLSELCGFQNFNIFGEQRYDIGNHTNWMLNGKPGGQTALNHVFSESFNSLYREELIKSKHCDTLVFTITKS